MGFSDTNEHSDRGQALQFITAQRTGMDLPLLGLRTATPLQPRASPSTARARHACLCTALGLLAALAFVGLSARAAVTEAWVHRYNNVVSNANDQAVKVVRDAA